MLVHFDSSFLTVHWDESSNVVWAQWKDVAGGEPMRCGLQAGLELVLQERSRKWLADTRQLGAMEPADVKWVSDDWLPRVVAGGVSSMAFVTPKKVIVQLAVKSFMSRINDSQLCNAYFDDLDAAFAWLRSQP